MTRDLDRPRCRVEVVARKVHEHPWVWASFELIDLGRTRMIEVDGPTERRNARIQFALVVVAGAVLLWFVVDDPREYAALVVSLILLSL